MYEDIKKRLNERIEKKIEKGMDKSEATFLVIL